MLKEISWAYNDPNPGDTETAAIKISSNGGNSYVVLIASGLADKTTHYIWNTRRVCNGDDYKLKIIVTDWRGLSGEAVSGGIFSIFNTNEPPELNLIYPTGGEILSGRVTVQWVFSDVNLTDIHDFDLSYSTNNGDNYTPLAYLQGDTTSYFWDTVLMNNATNYLLKIIAVESNTLEKYTAQSVSGSLFTLDNGNKGPSQFRLLLPEDKQSVNLLKFELEWEKNGDPNPEDTIYYTLYYSTDTNFSNFSFVQLMDNRCILTAKELSEDKVYYWRVEARDQFNSVTVSSSTFSFFVLNHNKALSKDKTVLAQASAGMPDGGFLFIEKVDPAGYSSISAAKDYSAGDRLMKVVSNDIYKVEVMDINQQVIEVENVTVNISFKYNDEDNDGYLDGTTVPVDKLKIAIMDGNRGSGKWIFPMDIQSIDKVNKQVSARSDKIYLFSLLGSNVPEKLLSNINVFPNPFAAGKENVRIRYVLKNNAEMDVKIYNLTGDLVKQWKYGPGLEGKSKGQQEGLTNEIQWNGENGLRNVVANGMYLCVIDVKTENEKQREIRNIGIVK
ncbi:MAG: hypothetical protein A3J83_04695 [Elusimicrobia bacterium RIFOXYA2_FULL_40_6]|nr:MAG: hypothetical protein A3J83_04695 [Elusimicrobia bacterium RIFOXYA2_FULL_40_6]